MFLALMCAVGLALAQGTTPTGVQRYGGIQLIRGETKIALGPTPPVETITDIGSVGFQRVDYTQYTPPPMPMPTTIGPCDVFTSPPATTSSSPMSTGLDFGGVININGPNGMKQLPQADSSPYLGGGTAIPGFYTPPPLYLDPGTYVVDNGAGGADVGPFSVTLNVPSPGFVWTNADSDLTIVRSAGVDIQWTGGDPNTNVLILGVAGTASFGCVVPNNGEYMVPSDVLSLLPASSPTGGGLTAALGSTLTVEINSVANFSASGLDMGTLLFSVSYMRTVVYQ